MDELQALISKYRSDPTSYSPDDFRRNLASWGPLLFYHLDAEVETLKPDILRRCECSIPFHLGRCVEYTSLRGACYRLDS